MKERFIRFKYLFSVILIVIVATICFPNQQVQASLTSVELANTYLNVSSKYLYLDVTGKDTFDFDIKAKARMKGARYTWYIKEDKGNPNALTIDSKTGLVTAKSIGTAYIRCKITLANHTVLRPEAKVIIRNNITGVEISNLTADSTFTVESKIDFDYIILNSAAGKDVETSGVARWELKEDTTKAGEVTEDGVVVPKCSGTFSVRAVCFESTEDYKKWLKNKVDYANCVTAASDWATIQVFSTDEIAENEKELKELLATKAVTNITLSTKNMTYTLNIPAGDYSDKTLTVNTPYVTIENHALFKKIIIRSASDTVWKEYATGNSFILYDSAISISIAAQSHVETIDLETESLDLKDSVTYNKIIMNVDGALNKLEVTAVSNITISGRGSIFVVDIAGLNNSKITTSIKTFIYSCSDFNASLLNGSEGTYLDIYGSATANVENLSTSPVIINNNSVYATLQSGYKVIITAAGVMISYEPVNTINDYRLTPRLVNYILVAPIKAGDSLSSSSLTATFQYGSTEVIGTLSWSDPSTIAYSSGYFKWIFTPADISSYTILTGEAYLTVK